MRYSASVLSIFMFAASSGCEHIRPSPDAEAKQRYETYGPKFTEEEKEFARETQADRIEVVDCLRSIEEE